MPKLAWLGFGCLSFVLFAAGILSKGTTAGVEFRQIFYLWAAVLYVMSFPIDAAMAERVIGVLRWLVLMVALVAAFRWIDEFTGLTGIHWGLLVGANRWRVLDSDQAVLVLLVWLWFFVRWARRGLDFLGTVGLQAMLLLVVMLQHRTVWVCGVVAVAVLCLLDREVRRAVLGRGLLTVTLATIAAALLAALGTLDEPLGALGQSIDEAFSGRGSTWSWRWQSWQELIGTWKSGGPRTWLLGQVYGSGWRRYIVDLQNVSNYSPHSFYVHTLLRGGLVGLLTLAVVYGGTVLRAAARLASQEAARPMAMFAFGAMTVIAMYSLTYNPDYTGGVVVGLVLSLLYPRAAPAQETRVGSMRPGWRGR